MADSSTTTIRETAGASGRPRRRPGARSGSGAAAIGAGIAAVAAMLLAGCAADGPAPAGQAPATSGPVSGPSASATDTPGATDAPGSGATGTGAIADAAAEWTLVSLSDGSGTVTSPLPAPTLDLRAQGVAKGSGGCNSFSASYDGTAAALTFAPVLSTKRACATGGDTESRYFAALEKVTAAKVGTRLTLAGEGVSLTFSRDVKQSVNGGSDAGTADN